MTKPVNISIKDIFMSSSSLYLGKQTLSGKTTNMNFKRQEKVLLKCNGNFSFLNIKQKKLGGPQISFENFFKKDEDNLYTKNY